MAVIRNDNVFILAAFILGFTENVTGLDTMLKMECLLTQKSREATQFLFRLQLVFTCFGVFAGFAGSGWVYERTYQFTEIAVLNFVMALICMACLGVVAKQRKMYRVPFIRLRDVDAELKLQEGSNARKSVVVNKKHDANMRITMADEIKTVETGEDGMKNVKSGLSEKPMLTDAFLWTMVACFYFTTLGISTQFAIAALFWAKIYDKGPFFTGSLMAAGEILGVLSLLFFSTPVVFHSPLTFHFGRPSNIVTTCLVMSVACLVITCGNIYIAAACTVFIHQMNVCIHSFQAEIVGACAPHKEFASWISRSYVVKRLANCTCVFGSIFLMGLAGPHAVYWIICFFLFMYGSILGCIYLRMGVFPFQRRLDGPETVADVLAKMPVEQLIERRASQRSSSVDPKVRRRTNRSESSVDTFGATGGARMPDEIVMKPADRKLLDASPCFEDVHIEIAKTDVEYCLATPVQTNVKDVAPIDKNPVKTNAEDVASIDDGAFTI